MDTVFFRFALLASFTILCQWFVFASVRKYLFKRYAPVRRKVAYPVLIGLGLLNYAAVELAHSSQGLPADSAGLNLMAVVYFNWLGCVLTFVLFFLLLGLISAALSVAEWIWALTTCKLSGYAAHPSQADSRSRTCNRGPELSGTDQALHELQPKKDCCVPELPKGAQPTRREFLRWSTATGMCGIFGLAGHGTAQGFGGPVLERHRLEHPSLAGLSSPINLIHVTDFHFGMFMGVEQLDHLVAVLNAIEGDALLITGDVFHSPVTPVDSAIRPLQGLRPRRLGNLVIMGNHDFYADESRTTNAFERSGLTLLRDRWVSFALDRASLHIGGIDDPMVSWVSGKEFPNFRLFARKSPQGAGMRILLSHRPAVLPYAADEGIDLVLAGHIHGGQIVIPRPGRERGLSIAEIASEYTYGWYSKHKTRMYLNRGVGMTFVPWRINCPPEIAVITLLPSTISSSTGRNL